MFPAQALQAATNYAAHVALSGSAGSPNQTTDFNSSSGTATVRWDFNTDGTIDRVRANQSSSLDWGDDLDPREWIGTNSEQTTRDVHLKFTFVSGDAATTLTAAYDGTWGKVMGAGGDGTAQVGWTQTGVGTKSGVYKVEISLDGGTTVHATGHYGGTAQVDSGA